MPIKKTNLFHPFFTLMIFLVFLFGWNRPGWSSDIDKLKVALLPIIDSLPFHVADEKGYFQEANISVEAIAVASALERDQLMQVNQIDGMINEMISVANFNRHKIQLIIVSHARSSVPASPLFRILASPKSAIFSADQLDGVPIGISRNTIIEYVTDRILAEKGLKPEQIVKQSVPNIPDRYQLLLQDRIKAATIPDPLGMSAIVSGAIPITDDSEYPHFGVSVLSFSTNAIDRKSEAIARFILMWDRAAAEINESPEIFRSLMLKRIQVPDNIKETFKIPIFPRGQIPTKSQWEDMIDWMLTKGLLDTAIPYENCMTEKYLPR
jgi:NitT/TauT family transport system substrate-binding protein